MEGEGGEGTDLYIRLDSKVDVNLTYLYLFFKAKSHLLQMCVYLCICVHVEVSNLYLFWPC